MNPLTTHAFDLPDRLSAKADPALIADDERHFADIARCLEESVAELTDRLDAERRAPGGASRQAMDRDVEIHRLTARLRTLRRFGLDLCLGRMDPADGSGPLYVGRLGLTDSSGRRLLVDWRSPAAEPFFGATHADPMGLAGRRRYRWTGGRVSDYWDEVYAPDAFAGHAALDDQSAFIASLGSTRSPRMRDVLGTIQADQDAVIRAGSRGTLVVDGGPGTGKTVVALHRSAYLLYADPRLSHRRGGVLFVGPHEPYLGYVADVLPSLGEEGVRTCTLRDLVAEGATAGAETDPEVARLKASAELVGAVEAAVRFYEEPPAEGVRVETHWSDIWLGPADWATAFGAAEPGTPHNEARDQIRDELIAILVDKHDGDAPEEQLRASLRGNRELNALLDRAWPLIEAADLVGDLWSVPAYLRTCAPWLSREEVRRLQRADARAWTESDLPILDAARQRLGDPEASRRRRRHEAAAAAEREQMDRVVESLLADETLADADADGEGALVMLRGADLRETLATADRPSGVEPDLLAGPFAHIVVDEAQELTDAQWQMLIQRCPSRSFTVVGDRAQAGTGSRSRGGSGWSGSVSTGSPWPPSPSTTGRRRRSWRRRAGRPGRAPGRQRAGLRPQQRRPRHPRPYRGAGGGRGAVARRARRGDRLRHRRARVPGDAPGAVADPGAVEGAGVRPGRTGRSGGVRRGRRGAVDRYVAMTRATRELVVLTSA